MLRTSTIRRFSFINSRAHEGRDRWRPAVAPFSARFNSRAHEGRDILFLLPARFSNRFNSRAREGRDAA